MNYIYLDFYNKNSMMCTSELFDPSSESDFKERSIQVKNQSMVLLVHQKNKIRIHLSIVIPTIFQHHVTFRNLSEGKGTVRLNSGQHRCFAIGEISSDLDRSSLCDIEKSSFKCFEIGLKMILPTQVHTQRITKTLLVHLPDL